MIKTAEVPACTDVTIPGMAMTIKMTILLMTSHALYFMAPTMAAIQPRERRTRTEMTSGV